MTALLQGSFSKMTDEELDALSSDDDSDSSVDEPVRKACGYTKSKNLVEEYSGFEEGFDEEDPLAKQMKSVLALKASLGIDNDKEFLAEHERNKLEREKAEDERERIANMSVEERLKHEQEQASTMFKNIARNIVKQKEYAWKKPEWALNSTLRSTEAGEKVKNGGDLQAPITQLPHLKHTESDTEEVENVQADENVDEQAEQSQNESVETKKAEPLTAVAKKCAWEKPEWAKQPMLRSTKAGQAVKTGGNLQVLITQAPELKQVEDGPAPRKRFNWEQPEWAKQSKRHFLRATEAGERVKTGQDLQRPITRLTQKESLSDTSNELTLTKKTQSKKSCVNGTSDPQATTTPSTATKILTKAKCRQSLMAEAMDGEGSTERSSNPPKAISRRNLMATDANKAPSLRKLKSKRSLVSEPQEGKQSVESPVLQKSTSRRNMVVDTGNSSVLQKTKSKQSLLTSYPGNTNNSPEVSQASKVFTPSLPKSKSKRSLMTEPAYNTQEKVKPLMEKSKSRRTLVAESADPAKHMERGKSRRNVMLVTTNGESTSIPLESLQKTKSKRNLLVQPSGKNVGGASSRCLQKSKSRRGLMIQTPGEESPPASAEDEVKQLLRAGLRQVQANTEKEAAKHVSSAEDEVRNLLIAGLKKAKSKRTLVVESDE